MAEDEVKREIGEYVHRQRAIARLKKLGLVFPKKIDIPKEFLDKNGHLIVPDDISDMPTDEIGRYLSIFTAMAVYYDVINALTDIDRVTAERVKDYVEAKVMLELKESKKYSSVTEMKAARDVNELVIRAQDWADSENAVHTLSTALLRGCERILFLLSREITRRGNVTTYEVRSKHVSPFGSGLGEED